MIIIELTKINDDEMKELGRKIDTFLYEYDGYIYRLVRTHQTEPYSYYYKLQDSRGKVTNV